MPHLKWPTTEQIRRHSARPCGGGVPLRRGRVRAGSSTLAFPSGKQLSTGRTAGIMGRSSSVGVAAFLAFAREPVHGVVRRRNMSGMKAVVRRSLALTAVLLVGCSHITTPDRSTEGVSQHPTSSSRRPLALCNKAVHAAQLTAAAVTLREARSANFGGPYPGITPASGSFPELAATTNAAWCWALSAGRSPGGAGQEWTLYLAVPDGRASPVFHMGGVAVAPTGPPSIP